jgi:hypothetical protein
LQSKENDVNQKQEQSVFELKECYRIQDFGKSKRAARKYLVN